MKQTKENLMNAAKRILIVEDLPSDAELAKREIASTLSPCVFEVVETKEDFLAAIEQFQPDLIISDYRLPHFDGMTALTLAQQHVPGIPFIILTGSMNEEIAVECMRAGATDYVIKEHIKRLGLAIVGSLEQRRVRLEKELAEAEEHRIQAALKESEERYRSLFENMVEGYAYCRMLYENEEPVDFIYLNVNSSFERLTGLKNVVGKKVSEVIPGIRKNHPELFESYGRVALTGKPERLEAYLESLKLWFSIVVYSQEKEYFVAIFDNITERKWAYHALKESESRYRALFESGPLPKWLYNPRTLAILAVNNAAIEHYGYSRDEFLTMTVKTCCPAEEAERFDAALDSTLFQHHQAGLWKHLKKDGTVIDVDIYTHEVILGGEPLRIAVLYDMTDLKRAGAALAESEEKYRLLVENASEAIYVVHEGVVVFGNSMFRQMSGLNPSEVAGESIYDLISPEEYARVQEHHAGILQGVVPTRSEEFRIAGKRGSEQWVAVNAVPITWQGHPATLNFATDITERKRAEETREATVELLRLCNKASSSRELVQDLMRYFRKLTGCDAVGIRLREGEDFPYYETHGFPEEFVLAETHLCAIDQKGEMVRDSVGHPVLDCMCGNILCGRFDPSKPFFSPRGSFWSSCTTGLLASTTETDRQAKTRNRCNGEGYESVALVPLRMHGETFGLFQFNDKRKGQFTADKVALIEQLVDHVAIALAKLRGDEALQESNEFNQQIIDSAQEGVVVHGQDLRFQVWNRFMESLTGLTADEVLGKEPIEVFPFLQEAGVIERLNMALAGQMSAGPDFRYHYPASGRSGWLSDTYGPLLNIKGEIFGVIATVRDITERKHAEEALGEKERYFRSLLYNIHEDIVVIDRDYQITDLNDSVLKTVGGTRDQIVGRHCFEILHGVNKPCVLKGEACPLRETFEKGTPRNCRHEHVHPNGSKVYVDILLSPLKNEAGEVTHVIEAMRDISDLILKEQELRKSRERFIDLFDHAPVGYLEYDREGRITQVNQTAVEMLGYSASEMIGCPLWEFTVDKEAAHDRILAKVAGAVSPDSNLERMYRRKDGSIFPVLCEDRLIFDEEGKIAGIRFVIQDISDRKREEEEKETLREQLRQSQKMEAIGRLAGGIAHDFNNLLTIIKGYSQLPLIDLKEGDSLRENFEEIQSAAERAARLTRQILAFSRRQILDMKILDLNAVLRDLDKMLRRVIGEDIELVTLLDEALGKVKTDSGQIEQVIMNLAVNARDAMPDGGKLAIETTNVELDEEYAREHIAGKPGRYVMLAVSDTGVGMTPEIKERVFEPFFTTKEKGKGTGLGLSMVYGIVKQSGGNIWVYSEPGQGTTFKIYLPREDEGMVEESAARPPAESVRGGETILIVEDEENVRKLAALILRRQGYRVLQASNGNEALDICKTLKEPLDLVLTDMVMPGMNGKRVVEELGRIQAGFKTLYMSGYTDDAIIHEGVLDAGTDFLEKPFTVDGLIGKVREVLDK